MNDQEKADMLPGGAPSRPLFTAFPSLVGRVPFVPLAGLPTPLDRMERLSAVTGAEIWIKRDGLSHPVYGGNKLRKFEFVFGDLLRRRARVVLTGGGLGSHHTLATGVIARQFGVQPVCSYTCQPITDTVRQKLRQTQALGIEPHFSGDYPGQALALAWQYLRWFLRTGRLPYFIYPGASSVLGVLGYANAAYEIRAQLEQAAVSAPAATFVAAGSCGTFAGLLLGARLAGLKGRMIGVRVIGENVANQAKIARMVNRTARYLRRQDPSIPEVHISPDDVELLGDYFGDSYAHPTAEGRQAVDLVSQTEGLCLETTYTGKAMAALLDHARSHPGSRLFFIDTFSEAPALPEGDWHHLPRRFWPIFDSNQPAWCWCWRAQRDPESCWKKSQQPIPKGAKNR